MSGALLAIWPQTSFATGTPEDTDDPGYLEDDVIQLGGVYFPIKGVSVVDAISEFETGLKIGPATYDNREHAFYLIMDDFSGGIGTRFRNVREELGSYWFAGQDNAIDARRAKYMCLPPKQTNVTDTSPTAHSLEAYWETSSRSLGHRITGINEGDALILNGTGVYKTSDGGYTFTKQADLGSSIFVNTGIAEGIESQFGAPVFVAGYQNGFKISSVFTSYNWVVANESASLTDMIWWDKKLLVADPSGIYFFIWSVDASNHGIMESNLSDVNDGEHIFEMPNRAGSNMLAGIRFIGAAQAPWGEPALYFHDTYRLWVLDFFARKAFPIEFGFGRRIIGCVMFNGMVLTTDGFNVWEYNPGSATVRNLGLPDKQGIPSSLLASSGGDWRLRCLIPADKDLYAVMTTSADVSSAPRSILYCFNGLGWHQIGVPLEYGVIGGMHLSSRYYNRRSIILWGASTTAFTSGAQHTYYQLPTFTDTPIVGRDSFGASGATLTDSWMDGGFLDLEGTLLRMRIDALYLTSTETVKVEYQLDNDESSTWYQLVDEDNVPAVFDATHTTLFFSTNPNSDLASYNPRKGISFRTVRFRYTFNRGSDETLSPVVRAFMLMYLKVPEFRQAVTATIDVNRMLEDGQTEYYIDGERATLRTIYTKLQEFWNSHTLLELTVPNLIPTSDNCYVRITAMPVSFDDFRDSVEGRSSGITLTLLEPLERVA